MAQDISDGDRLRAEGVEITFADGKVHHLKYGMRAMLHLEREFGSIGRFAARLAQDEWGEDRLRAICTAMVAGLLHEKPADITREAFANYVEDNLDFDVLIPWIEKIDEALAQARPPSRGEAVDPKATGSASSPGTSSTTSSRSNTRGRTRRSGT